MAQQQLHRSQIFCAPGDECWLRPAHCEKKIAVAQGCYRYPVLQALPGSCGEFELDGLLGLLLHYAGPRCHMASMADIVDAQLDQVAATQFAVDRPPGWELYYAPCQLWREHGGGVIIVEFFSWARWYPCKSAPVGQEQTFADEWQCHNPTIMKAQ